MLLERNNQVLYLDFGRKPFGLLAPKGVDIGPYIVGIKHNLKVEELIGLDQWNINHFCPVGSDCNNIHVENLHLLSCEDGSYLFYGTLFVLDKNGIFKKVNWSYTHEINEDGVLTLHGLPFYFLKHAKEKHIYDIKVEVPQTKHYNRFKHVRLKGRDFYAGKKVIIAKINNKIWKFYKIGDKEGVKL